MRNERFHRLVCLVRHNAELPTARLERVEHFRYAGVGARQNHAVFRIVALEGCKHAVGHVRCAAVRHGALNELPYAVSDKAPNLVEAARRQALAFERKIRRGVQILKRVQQSSVQIKYRKFFHSLSSAMILIHVYEKFKILCRTIDRPGIGW